MLPFETVSAAFPPSVKADGVNFPPPTLLHAVALEALGVEIDGDVPPKSVWTAAWVLSLDDPSVAVRPGEAEKSASAFMEAHKDDDFDNLSEAVNRALGLAVSTFVPGKAEKGDKQNLDGLPDGFGWPIEIAERIAHEHSMPFTEAMKIPLVTALAIIAMIRARYGGEFCAPDYYGRIRQKKQIASLMRHSAMMERKNKEATEDG